MILDTDLLSIVVPCLGLGPRSQVELQLKEVALVECEVIHVFVILYEIIFVLNELVVLVKIEGLDRLALSLVAKHVVVHH